MLSFLIAAFVATSANAQAFANYAADPHARYQELNFNTYSTPKDQINPYVTALSNFSDGVISGAVPFDQEMSFDKLMQIVQDKKLTRVEQVIAELPSNMLNENYVLMYRSRSLQDASFLEPRAIVFTPTASFALSFNSGDIKQKGSNSIEMVQFRYDQKRFEFRELTFDGQNVPKPSAANPRKCLACHQSPDRSDVDPRPNWEPYKVWIGAYGSNGGALTDSLRNQMHMGIELPQDKEVLDEQTHEVESYDQFAKQTKPTNPRYSLLGSFRSDAPSALTEGFTILDFMRVLRIVSSDSEIYPLYRETLAGMSHCDSPSVDENPALAWFIDFKYPQYYDYTQYEMSVWGHLGAASNILTYLFEAIGVDTSDWSLDFGTGGRFALFERFGTPNYTMAAFHHAWTEAVPDAAELAKRSCDDVYASGLAKLNAAYADGTLAKLRLERFKPVATGPEVLQRCVKCHVDPSEGIPALPFDNLATLGKKLSQPFSKHGTFFDEIVYRTSDMALQDERMPANRRLTKVERENFLSYLKTLQ